MRPRLCGPLGPVRQRYRDILKPANRLTAAEMDRLDRWDRLENALSEKELTSMSNFLEIVRGLLDPAAQSCPCTTCGSESVWRASGTEAYRCRTCDPPTSLPVAEAIGPFGKVDAPLKPAKGDLWLQGWKEVAAITGKAPASSTILDAIAECDTAFERGDFSQFRKGLFKVTVALQQHQKATHSGETAA